MKLDVIVSPAFLSEGDIKDCLCAVVDVLRATSTITTALISGAKAVYPCLSIDEARNRAASLGREHSLLGGEDRGRFIPGFDLGNSPLEYKNADVVGKNIVTYTSNGTGTIRKAYAGCGSPVYIASLINVSAVSSALAMAAVSRQIEGIAILCSGRYGNPSAEDLFCAGLLIERITAELGKKDEVSELTDGARIAVGFATANEGLSLDVLSSSDHGSFLQTIGFSQDLEFASQLDTYNAVPVFDGERVVLSANDN